MYAKFFKMINFGVPLPAAKIKMQAEGVDPSVLECVRNAQTRACCRCRVEGCGWGRALTLSAPCAAQHGPRGTLPQRRVAHCHVARRDAL